MNSVQTFLGFANGRYIFSSTDGFLNYVRNPNYVECSNGTTSQTGACPAGTDVTGPVLLYLQQAGVGGLSVEEAGTQSIPQIEPAVFIQDKWQPSRNLTIQYGLRWEAQIEPSLITPKAQVFYAPFIGTTREGVDFPSDGTIPSDKKMFQPRLGISWDPKGDGKTVVRLNAGIFYGRIPGLSVASSRSTNGSRGQTLFRNSALTAILGPVPAYPNLIPRSEIGSPDHPDVFVIDKDFQNPRTYSASVAVEREVAPETSLLVQYNHAKTVHLTRFVDRNDPLLGSPWSTGIGPDGSNGIGVLTTVESSAKSLYRGLTLGLNKKWSHNWQAQANYTYSKDLSDDDNERDPFTFRYAKITDLAAEYGPSDRDQRHRFNGFVLWQAPGAVNVNVRYSYRSAAAEVHQGGRQRRQHPAGPHQRRRHRGHAQPGPQGQLDLGRGPAPLPHVPAGHGRHAPRADRRDLQPAEQQEPQASRGDEPGLQLRRHGAERPRRPAAGQVGPALRVVAAGT